MLLESALAVTEQEWDLGAIVDSSVNMCAQYAAAVKMAAYVWLWVVVVALYKPPLWAPTGWLGEDVTYFSASCTGFWGSPAILANHGRAWAATWEADWREDFAWLASLWSTPWDISCTWALLSVRVWSPAKKDIAGSSRRSWRFEKILVSRTSEATKGAWLLWNWDAGSDSLCSDAQELFLSSYVIVLISLWMWPYAQFSGCTGTCFNWTFLGLPHTRF